MFKIICMALVLLFTLASTQAQNFSSEELARRAIERRAIEAVIWGMPAVNYDLMYQEMVRKAKGGFNQIALLVAAAGLEEPDAHAEPRRDLSDAVLQHQGRRSRGAGDSAGR